MASVDRHIEARKALASEWASASGSSEPPTLAELQYVQASALLEGGYGYAEYHLLDHASSTPEHPVVLASSGIIWNGGAVQTNDPDHGFLATDTGPGHVTPENPHGYYDHLYRVYPNQAAGLHDVIHHMTAKRPYAWQAMKTGDIDETSERLHAVKGKLDPISKSPGYFEQKPSTRAGIIEKNIAEISSALGEPIAAKRGGPVTSAPDGGGGLLPSVSTPAKVGLIGFVLAALALAAKHFLGGR